MSGKGRCVLLGMGMLAASNSFGTMVLSLMARPKVAMVAQCNILIWDPETKTEHLIQSSAVTSQEKRFEILIPTPLIPRVKEVGNAPIDLLANLLIPKAAFPVKKKNPEDELDKDFGTLIRGGVEVQQVAIVGNLKATTIKASDILALSEWMEKNKYKANAAQKKWLEGFVQKRWFLTALQVNSESEALKTSAFRLSFKTEVPVVPYTSPQNNWVQGIKQEMFVVSPVPLQGAIGGKLPWNARLMGHKYLSRDDSEKFAKTLGLNSNELPKHPWADRFQETSVDNVATEELYFVPVPKAAPVPIGNPKATRSSKRA